MAIVMILTTECDFLISVKARQSENACPRSGSMATRHTVALFLSTLALAGGTVACSRGPEAGEDGGDRERPEMTQPSSRKGGEAGEGDERPEAGERPAGSESQEGGEGGEGGEG